MLNKKIMPKNIVYVGKHSKDRALAIYLPKRVYVDEGEGVEAISGIVKISPEKAASLSSERGLFAGVLCKFIYECYDFDVDVVDHTLYERTMQLFPKVFDSPDQPKNLQLPDEYHFPFTFRLPQGLPPSISLHLGFVYMGRPIGISYEVFACIGQLNDIKGKRSSRTSMRFRKSSYFPMLKDIQPHQEKEKNFIMSSNRPLQLKATLDKEIYLVGEPINVHVHVLNESKHDVHAIRISAKQVVLARIHGGEKEKYKCQVALLESSRHCPVKRHSTLEETFTITPKVLESEAYHVAHSGRVNLSETPVLAPSTRDDETPKDRKGLAISYYLNVHACVTMGTDLIVKVPFILSGNERREDADETVRVVPSQEMIDRLIGMGYTILQATRALSRNNNDVNSSISWLKQNPAALEAKDQIFEGNPQNLLINFEDDVEHSEQTQINISGQNNFNRMPLDQDATFGDAYDSSLVKSGISLLDDISAAVSMTTTTKADFLTLQAAAAQGLLAPLPYQSDEMSHLNFNVSNVGAKISDLIADISMYDANTTYSSGKEAALAVRRLVNVVKSVASHISNRTAQQELLQISNEIVEKCLNLFETAQQFMISPMNSELRIRMKKLAQHISANTPRILEALPGQRDIIYAISTINTALGQLEHSKHSPNAPSLSLEIALGKVNGCASELSLVFHELGSLIHSPPEEKTLDQLAQIARVYQNILPPLLFAADQVVLNVGSMPRLVDLNLMIKTVGTCNVQLLQSCKGASLNPTDPTLKVKVEMCARNVVEAMKQLLTACNVLIDDKSTPNLTASLTSPQGQESFLNGAAMSPTGNGFMMNGGSTRRDGFDGFIRRRLEFNPSLTDMPSSELDMTADEVQIELSKQLLAISTDIEDSNKLLLAARVQKPRPKSSVSFDGFPSSPPANSATSSAGSVLDQALSITSAACRLVECAQARRNELLILGKGFSTRDYERDSDWAGGLLSAAKAVAGTIAHLVKIVHSPELDRTAFENIIITSNEVSSTCARLLSASRVEHQTDSHTQLDLEEASKHVTRATHRLSSTARAMIDQMDEQSEDDNANQESGDMVSLTEEKIKEMEHQLRVLKLQEELEKERTKLFELRRKAYPIHE